MCIMEVATSCYIIRYTVLSRTCAKSMLVFIIYFIPTFAYENNGIENRYMHGNDLRMAALYIIWAKRLPQFIPTPTTSASVHS